MKKVEKAAVIGCPGAGKSVFSRRLRDITGLPLYYLDMIWHRPDRTNCSREEFDARLGEIVKKDSWIIDGNYLRTLPVRLKECDTVFLLDFPLEVCLDGARGRVGQEREDMPWIETEFDEEFCQWILDFPKLQLPEIYRLLGELGADKEIVIFKSRREAQEYLDRLEKKEKERKEHSAEHKRGSREEAERRQLYQMKYSSPIGILTLTADRENLLSLEFEQERYPFSIPENCKLAVLPAYDKTAGGSGQPGRDDALPAPLLQAADWLDLYFSGQKPDFLPPMKPEGSAFRLRVWKELLKIPYGGAVTYGSIAKKLAEEDGRPHMSAQAVGGAVGHNPIGIIIPCHRVIGADGSLTGFGGGIETKKALLGLEGGQG